jgi:midasin
LMPELMSFNLQVPTTRHNAMRVFRACQLQKPILLEGSPGVGKTTLISALANISGHHLCRINLSDQTDLMDLFGSDLPVEGGKPGEFAWKDAEFLRALQEGHWVLLDEMNLAPQAVLEGLNAVLDHRGTVFIPELGRTFTRHPSFRIFAAQNPLHQGGGRKGLPKSFVNRFTKVYVEELTPSDLLLVVRHLFPDYPAEVLERMIAFNTQLNDAVAMRRIFGKEGAPWEFNLRDVFRWASLLRLNGHILHPVERLWPAYLCRFRNEDDRVRATALFATIFSCPTSDVALAPHVTITDSHVQIGSVWMSRHAASMPSPGPLLQTHAKAMEAAALAISQSSLVILTGAERTGKKTVVQNLARVTGHTLHRISIHSNTDTTDILGSFEQVDLRDRILPDLLEVLSLVKQILSLQSEVSASALFTVERYVSSISPHPPTTHVLDQTMAVLSSLPPAPRRDELITSIRDQRKSVDQAARFEWVDGTLIRALREGHWLLMENANLCNASVLDRLNSLCEPGGSVVLNERGHVHGQVQVVKPHPSFRLFMTVNPQNGELSRAMRNRGIEIALHHVHSPFDSTRLALNHVLPASWGSRSFGPKMMTMTQQFETVRRGLSFDTTLSIPQATPSLPQDDDDESSRILATYSSSFALPTDDQLQLIALRQFSTSALPQRSLQTLRRSLPHQSQLLDSLAHSGLVEYLGRLRAAYSRTWGVPSNLLCSQVSADHFQIIVSGVSLIHHVLNTMNISAVEHLS